MQDNSNSYPSRFYQSANTDAEIVKDSFLIRIEEFNIIMADVRNNPMKGSVQHYLLIGRRGSGKSTLLRRIQIEIEEDEHLNKKFVAINLSEEQADIYRLFDLLDAIIEELEEHGIEVKAREENDDCDIYTRALISVIHEAIEKSGRKVVLLLDNIDRIFENLKEDSALLREMLLNFDDIKIIGGSTRMSEYFWSYNEPFYEFFRELPLKPMTTEEIKTLLLYWSDKTNIPALREFVEQRQGQLETIRQLTDGLPRTLQFFINILVNNAQESGYEYLRQIMDKATPQYQERLNILPPAQRKLVLKLAFIWEGASTKDIAAVVKMENSTVSAQLKQLADKGIVEKLDTGSKNHLYRLTERFFNLWLIFTQGSPKEKRRAKYLTVFMENFYDRDGLRSMAVNLLKQLEERKLTSSKAAMLTKALVHSRYIDSDMRDKLINSTMQLADITEEMKSHLPSPLVQIEKDIDELIEKKKWEKAIVLAEDIEQEDGIKEALLGRIYQAQDDIEQAIRYYTTASDKGISLASSMLGYMYVNLNDLSNAEKYLLVAVKQGDKIALNNLGLIYIRFKKYDEAEKVLLTAVNEGVDLALSNLGLVYHNLEDYETAEKYYLEAQKKLGNYDNLLVLLGVVFELQQKYDLAEEAFLTAIEDGRDEAFLPLGTVYFYKKQYTLSEKYLLNALPKQKKNASYLLGILYSILGGMDKAEEYYLMAIEAGENKVHIFLAQIYRQQQKNELAIKHYNEAIENGDTKAHIDLAEFYIDLGEMRLAEINYLAAIEHGFDDAIYFLAELYADQNRYKEAEIEYLKAIEKGDNDALYGLATIYREQKRYKQAELFYKKCIAVNDKEAMLDLGTLYGEQKRYSLAEKYIKQAMDAGNDEASEALALLYYEQNINKDIAPGLLINKSDSEFSRVIGILIDIWQGNLGNVAADVRSYIKYELENEEDVERDLLIHLLIHYQVNLVSQLFNDAEFGDKLRERFEPIYYAVKVLEGKDSNIRLKIPPEINHTVKTIIKRVKEGQELYYKK